MTSYVSHLRIIHGDGNAQTSATAGGLPPGGYTGLYSDMKTAISVPDEIFSQVETRAAELGISRSEFFTRAARQYLGQLADASLTQQIDAAIDAAGSDDSG